MDCNVNPVDASMKMVVILFWSIQCNYGEATW